VDKVSTKTSYVIGGVVMGILVSLLSVWTDKTTNDSQEMLSIKAITRGPNATVQSTIVSLIAVVLPALILASAVALIVRKKTP
jgi:mannose/fructose/N-acetylgalactosamine-specific phosphotransferase system component IID